MDAALLESLCQQGTPQPTGGNHPFLLDDPQAVWWVAAGSVDVFSVSLSQAGEPSDRQYLFTVAPGQLLWGLAASVPVPIGFLAVASLDGRVSRLPLAALWTRLGEADAAARHAVTQAIEGWITALAAAVTGTLRPRNHATIEAGEETSLPEKTRLCSAGPLVWVEHRSGISHLVGDETVSFAPGGLFPLVGRAALEVVETVTVRGWDTATLLADGRLSDALTSFHERFGEAIVTRRSQRTAEDRRRLDTRCSADRQTMSDTVTGLAGLITGQPAAVAVDDPKHLLHGACRLVFAALGVSLGPPPRQHTHGLRDPVATLAETARLRSRKVGLRGAWWEQELGPLLAFASEDQRPVALLPTTKRGYVLHDVARGTKQPVTRAVAETLDPFAVSFYRRLPTYALRAADLVRFGLFGSARDLGLILVLGGLVGLLGMVVPIGTGLVFDRVIPGAERLQLVHLGSALLASTLVIALFEVARGFAILRLEGRLGAALQAGVWDRLIDLPADFFHNYSAGDLANRAFGIDTIRHTLSANTVATLMGSVFGLCNALLLFYFDLTLGFYGLGLGLLAVAVTVVSGVRQLGLQRPATELEGKISGLVLQLITGIAKLRTAGAEVRAFARWAELFRQQRWIALRTRAPLQVFNAVYPILASLLIYQAVAHRTAVVSAGAFIAYITAFNALLYSTLQTCSAVLAMLHIGPTYRRLTPILEATPEIDEHRNNPGPLDGDIELAHVSFRYSDQGPAILNDVSLQLRPGEFVALVGASGSGKSTLLRLLLGFEQPSAGKIYYSGHDLGGVDVRSVRRQIGVVLQNGQLLSGDIFTNIIGSSNLTREDALEAVRLAGFDKDLDAMPMGLHTFLGEGATTLSGGQRQRLMIARAIVRKPRILFFDEATSALDNTTQAIVSESIAKLEATRLVIAHRLSTILHADRIVVLDRGSIVQTGRYAELMAQPGPFADLARRQLL